MTRSAHPILLNARPPSLILMECMHCVCYRYEMAGPMNQDSSSPGFFISGPYVRRRAYTVSTLQEIHVCLPSDSPALGVLCCLFPNSFFIQVRPFEMPRVPSPRGAPDGAPGKGGNSVKGDTIKLQAARVVSSKRGRVKEEEDDDDLAPKASLRKGSPSPRLLRTSAGAGQLKSFVVEGVLDINA